jgi:hypothetical protein
MVTEKPPRWARFRLSLSSRVGSFYNIINIGNPLLMLGGRLRRLVALAEQAG